MSELDLANIQGFVVRGYRLPLAGYLFLRIEHPTSAREWLAQLTPHVLTAARWTEKPDSGVNLALSFEGLRALGVPDASLDEFPTEFKQGMAARAGLLGDVGESAPENWEAGFGGGAHGRRAERTRLPSERVLGQRVD